MKNSETEKRWLRDCPVEIERDALRSAAQVVGRGYTPDYYASIASSFMWLYRAGYKQALADEAEQGRL